MFLRKATSKKTGRTYLSIVHGYYDPETRTSRTKTIESLGYLDELAKDYVDPISHFDAYAKKLEAQRVADNASYSFSIGKQELLPACSDNTKNFGYAALSSIYHALRLHIFFANRQRHTKEEFDADTIMKMLVYSRLLFPASKKKSFENRERFFEKTNYSLDDVYRFLTFLAKRKEPLLLWMNREISRNYGRDTSLLYYDVTNYYFETDEPDDFVRKGVSKEHRPNPIVQMGLFIDNNAIPITYELFPGNTNDCLTYRPNFGKIKKDYNVGRVITVADKGMTTGDNIWYTKNTPTKDGYVFSMSVRGGDKKLKDYVLKQDGYEWLGNEYKRKSRIYPRTIKVTAASGKKIKKVIDEKQVVFYSLKYDKRAKEERAKALAKAQDMVRHPGSYTSATSYGAAGYIKNIHFDKETGEITTPANLLELDEEKIKQEEALDGYYLLITSELNESDDRIIEIYRGLWKIEESFRITKSDLESRPVFVKEKSHIEAHFLTCFVALTIARILEWKTGRQYSLEKMLESLAKSNCVHVKENLYLFSYHDKVLECIGEKTGIEFNRKMLALGEIKKILGKTKKVPDTQ